MTDRFKRRIISHLADRRYVPRQIRQLAHELGVLADEYDSFEQTLSELIKEGQVIFGSGASIALPPPGPEMIGTFRLARGGFGFVKGESATVHGDLFVPAPNTAGALTGDRVRASVLHERRHQPVHRMRYAGCIVEILQRAHRHYVGNLSKRGSGWMVRIDGNLLHQPVIIRDPHAKHAVHGDKVVVEILSYPTDDAPAVGVITEVLGEHGNLGVETQAVIRGHGLVETFSPDILAQARRAADEFDVSVVSPNRLDLRHEHVVTIDPPDAQDFDDAITIARLTEDSQGAVYELAVHIADVAHFVQTGSALDQEAAQRGNSAYLPRKVIPMLPELLSSGVCSLQEQEDRYCKTVFLRYNADGQVCGQRFARTLIRSNKRLTYREAQALIDGDLPAARKHARTNPKYPRYLIEQLKLMDELARLIQHRRLRMGMITLDLPEVELIFDDSGRLVDVRPQDDAFTHEIIEMFMVEANEATARLFDALEVPMVRRVHAEPPAHDMKQLHQFARVAGYNVPAFPTRAELQVLLNAVRGKPEQYAVHLAVLKTLSRAEYTPMKIGHFALASEHYTHFTSPIRRYPDLVVHRGLDAYLDTEDKSRGGDRRHRGQLPDDLCRIDTKQMAHLAAHCSSTERNAEAAERELRNYLVLDLLSKRLGEDFDGTVTGLTSTGLFVQIDRYLVDGFIHVSQLPATGVRGVDRWQFNHHTGAFVAERSGKTISIGDHFTVRIAKVEPAARRMDLEIVNTGPQSRARSRQRTQPAGAARSHQEAMRLKQIRRRDHRRR